MHSIANHMGTTAFKTGVANLCNPFTISKQIIANLAEAICAKSFVTREGGGEGEK